MDRSIQPDPQATPRSAGKDGSNEQSEASERVLAAVQRNPRRMTMQLARELGVPEVEVIRALPNDRAVELDVSQWEALVRSLEALGPLRVLVSNGAATVEVVGQFGGFSTSGEFFNIRTDSLDMHIRWPQLAAVFAVQKPGHMDGHPTHSIQFFDQSGAATFKVFLTFGGPAPPDRVRQFTGLRNQFRLSR